MDDVLQQLLDDFVKKNSDAKEASAVNQDAQAAAVNAKSAFDAAAADKESSRRGLLQAIQGA